MKKKVLFLCSGTSCHSQMAEGLLKHFYGNKYEVFSAGMTPASINQSAIDVMQEIGIDISQQVLKPLKELANQKFDIIITLCDTEAEISTDFFSETRKINWKFFDPSEGLEYQKDLPKALREIRDEMKEKIIEHFNLDE